MPPNPIFDNREFQYARGPKEITDEEMETRWCRAFGCKEPEDGTCNHIACRSHKGELDEDNKPEES